MPNDIGQYDREYAACPCFWGKAPAKYVRQFSEMVATHAGRALDLGAGEGKNSFYLKELGYEVTAVEVSPYAAKNFIDRIISEEISEPPTIILGNVMDVVPDGSWNIVVAYGLLHCMRTLSDLDKMVQTIMGCTAPGGWNIISSFTNEIGVPSVQDYLAPTLVEPMYVHDMYASLDGWTIKAYEPDVITETHPTSNIPHQHSLYRLITQKHDV